MGTEKGQLRRTQNIVMAANKVNAINKNPLQGIFFRCGPQKWLNWVELMGVQSVGLVGFYLGNARSKNNTVLTGEEREFILRELFCDAVNIGALNFSAKVAPKDFSFKLEHNILGCPDLLIEYAPKGAVRVTGKTYFYDYFLEGNCKSDKVLSILYLFQVALQRARGS